MSFMFLLLAPPAAFILFLLLSAGFSRLAAGFAARGKDHPLKERPYASGEKVPVIRQQPDYSQFFPFAFFFTIMDVTVLLVSTVPETRSGIEMVAVYLGTALLSLSILFRKGGKTE